MSDYAQVERAALCAAARAAGPDAPTLCEGWRVVDLVAHLIVRERRPLAGVGILVGPLAPYTTLVQRRVGSARPFEELVEVVRKGPPLALRPIDEVMNTVEYFVHAEDIRRAAPGFSLRHVEPLEEKAIFQRLKAMARLVRRRCPGPLDVDAEGFGRLVVRSGSNPVVVSGAPSELTLYLTGRQKVAKVDVAGPLDAVAAMYDAALGF